VVGVQVGERDRLDRRRVAAQGGEVVQQRAAVDGARDVAGLGGERLRAEPRVDQQCPAVAFHQ
jgi:hypothetical protein